MRMLRESPGSSPSLSPRTSACASPVSAWVCMTRPRRSPARIRCRRAPTGPGPTRTRCSFTTRGLRCAAGPGGEPAVAGRERSRIGLRWRARGSAPVPGATETWDPAAGGVLSDQRRRRPSSARTSALQLEIPVTSITADQDPGLPRSWPMRTPWTTVTLSGGRPPETGIWSPADPATNARETPAASRRGGIPGTTGWAAGLRDKALRKAADKRVSRMPARRAREMYPNRDRSAALREPAATSIGTDSVTWDAYRVSARSASRAASFTWLG